MWKPLFIAAALVVTCGCSFSQDKAAAEAGVERFRRMMDAGEYRRIYETSSPDLKRAASEAEFTRILGLIRDRLGQVRQADQTGWRVNYASGGNLVNLVYATRFGSGRGTEDFVFRVNGGSALLAGYHVNSPDLIGAAPAPTGKPKSGQPRR